MGMERQLSGVQRRELRFAGSTATIRGKAYWRVDADEVRATVRSGEVGRNARPIVIQQLLMELYGIYRCTVYGF